jgi:hypothetical protein
MSSIIEPVEVDQNALVGIDVAGGVDPASADEPVSDQPSLAADQQVVAILTAEYIGAVAADDRVVAAGTAEVVIAVVAVDGVGAVGETVVVVPDMVVAVRSVNSGHGRDPSAHRTSQPAAGSSPVWSRSRAARSRPQAKTYARSII